MRLLVNEVFDIPLTNSKLVRIKFSEKEYESLIINSGEVNGYLIPVNLVKYQGSLAIIKLPEKSISGKRYIQVDKSRVLPTD